MSFLGLIRLPSAILAGAAILVVVVGVWLQKKETFMVSGDYDVFLSFRGPDTRIGFADYLYNKLHRKGVRVFRDANNLPWGKDNQPELVKAITSSKIAIPIISKDYARSQSCLWELVVMKKCREDGGQLIFPIFYNVSMDEVRELKGKVGEAFGSLTNGRVDANVERRWEEAIRSVAKSKGYELLKVDANAMHEWEEALQFVGKIKGWESHKIANGYEGVLVTTVVNKVFSELGTISLDPSGLGSIINRLIRARSDDTENHFQVFLNFFDKDTGAGFSDYLYTRLVDEGVRVYNVDDPFFIGKDFDEEEVIRDTIKNCKISIPIISPHYASCERCLRELVQIMDPKKRLEDELIPVFYKVPPGELRNAKTEFEKACENSVQGRNVTNEFENDLISHLNNGFAKSTVAEWVQALRNISYCTGIETEKKADRHEGEIVEMVVANVMDVLKKLNLSQRNIFSAWLSDEWDKMNKLLEESYQASLSAGKSLLALLGLLVFAPPLIVYVIIVIFHGRNTSVNLVS